MASFLAASLGKSDQRPVGSLIRSAPEAALVYEGLQQDGGIIVYGLPVIGEGVDDKGQELGGEVSAFDPGQDQEAGIVDDKVTKLVSVLFVPADPLIPVFDVPG